MASPLVRVGLLAILFLAGCETVPPPPAAPSSSPPPPTEPSDAPVRGVRQRVPEAELWTALCEGPHAYPMDVVGSRHFVNIALSGPSATATLRFHVDTGGNTPGLAVKRSAVAPLGFTTVESLPRSLQIDGREVKVPDGAAWLLLDETSKDRPRKGFSVGQVGAGFLSRFVVCIDPQKGTLGLTPPEAVEITDDSTSITFIPMLGGPNRAVYPFVHLRITDHTGAFTGGYGVLLDTGATTTMLDSNKIDYQKKAVPTRPHARGAAGDADMVGGQWAEEMVRVERVAIGTPSAYVQQKGISAHPYIDLGSALIVERPTGTFDRMFGSVSVTMGSHGALANDVLLRFRMVIDYPGGRLWLAPSGRVADASSSMVRVGVALDFREDGCPVFRQITSTNSKATIAALSPGDVLLEIDGEGTCALYHHELSTRLAGKVGDKKKLTIERAGQRLTVEAAVADLLPRP